MLGALLAGSLILTGCGSDETSEAEQVTPTPTTLSGEVIEVPTTVKGADWCEEAYIVYMGGNASTPTDVAQALEEFATQAGNEPEAQQAFTELATAIKSRTNSDPGQLPSEEEVNAYLEADTKVNEAFAQYCGGESVMELFYEQNK